MLAELALQNMPLGKAPVATLATIPDTAAGVCAFIASVVTLGRYEEPVRMMQRDFRALEYLPSLLFASVVNSVNPYMGRTGSLANHAWECYENCEPSRVGLVVLLVKLVFARALDAIIGALALLTSLATLGSYQKANELAYRHLTGFLGIVFDVTLITVKMLNLDSSDIYSQ